MNISRREFLNLSFKSLIMLLGLGLPRQLLALADEYNWEEYYWAYGIDIEKCLGCGRCVTACKAENNVPDHPFFFRTWVERYVERKGSKIEVDSPNGGKDGFPNVKDRKDVVKSFFVPKICNHCDKPPCVQVCPVGATYKTKDGVILVDQKYCIGCQYCIQACPYGARYLVPQGDTTPTGQAHVADKCTLCYHRITKGLRPACVDACPVSARIFGNLKDEKSSINKFLKEKKVQVLKQHLGTNPKVYYAGLDKEVH